MVASCFTPFFSEVEIDDIHFLERCLQLFIDLEALLTTRYVFISFLTICLIQNLLRFSFFVKPQAKAITLWL